MLHRVKLALVASAGCQLQIQAVCPELRTESVPLRGELRLILCLLLRIKSMQRKPWVTLTSLTTHIWAYNFSKYEFEKTFKTSQSHIERRKNHVLHPHSLRRVHFPIYKFIRDDQWPAAKICHETGSRLWPIPLFYPFTAHRSKSNNVLLPSSRGGGGRPQAEILWWMWRNCGDW